ncbi:uncharacterized protein VP01_77g3 [Puccinia sorghi]|uniref:RING-type domain-containing protein n=1 Tax=Puccinia sorghi TaxID=27349 RepID=A0A0L6UB58_9BASI|nr:uncharacterized protein VP01_77g3 [Puccinia sorghi]
MSQSRRKSNRQAESHPYISTSQSFVLVPRRGTGGTDGVGDNELFDVADEEKEIKKILKLIESDYLHQQLEPQVTEVHLKTAISDSKLEIRQLAQQLESIEILAGDLPEFNNTDIGDQILEDLDQHARDLIEAIQLVEFRQNELEDLRELVHRSSSSSRAIDAHTQLCKKLSDQQLKWDALTLRQKFGQNKRYKAFRDRIWEITGDGGAMPPIKTFLAAGLCYGFNPLQISMPGEEEDESSEDELEIAGGTQNYKCPLCLGYLKVPVVSQVCKHPFCRECFDSYLEQNQAATVACPNSGCSQTISAASVAVDEALAAKVRQYLRRVELREERQIFDDQDHSNADAMDPNAAEEDSKEHLLDRRKHAASQKKRRVIVDDDE